MSEVLKPPYVRKDDARGDFQVWIVDGPYIRGHIDEEFTNFGQHYRYPYIPDNEFWIDQEAEHDERAFFIDHLLVEHEMMAKGVSYEEAIAELWIIAAHGIAGHDSLFQGAAQNLVNWRFELHEQLVEERLAGILER